MSVNKDIKLGVSLYSYQDNYYFHRYDLEGCLAAAAGSGASGVEIFADTMIPEWPYVSDAWIDKWNGWMERYGLEPVCLDHFADRAMWHDRQLSDDEMFDRSVQYLELARRLGCSCVRILHEEHIGAFSFSGFKLVDYDLIKRLLPVAQEKNVMMALEVHTRDGVGAPYQQKYIELAEQTGIPFVGLQQDFSTFSYCLSMADIKGAVFEGADEDILMFIREKQREAYFAGDDFDYEEIREKVEAMKPNARTMALLRFAVIGHAGEKKAPMSKIYKDLADNASKLVYCHGKFYDFDENGQVDDMDYPKIFGILKENGYKGYISSEFEGNRRLNQIGWCDEIEYVRRHQQLMRSLLED